MPCRTTGWGRAPGWGGGQSGRHSLYRGLLGKGKACSHAGRDMRLNTWGGLGTQGGYQLSGCGGPVRVWTPEQLEGLCCGVLAPRNAGRRGVVNNLLFIWPCD